MAACRQSSSARQTRSSAPRLAEPRMQRPEPVGIEADRLFLSSSVTCSNGSPCVSCPHSAARMAPPGSQMVAGDGNFSLEFAENSGYQAGGGRKAERTEMHDARPLPTYLVQRYHGWKATATRRTRPGTATSRRRGSTRAPWSSLLRQPGACHLDLRGRPGRVLPAPQHRQPGAALRARRRPARHLGGGGIRGDRAEGRACDRDGPFQLRRRARAATTCARARPRSWRRKPASSAAGWISCARATSG